MSFTWLVEMVELVTFIANSIGSLIFGVNYYYHSLQIVGTSKNFQKRKRHSAAMASDSEDSYSSSSHAREKSRVQSFTPSTPPPTSVNYRTAKRRKGIPHRSPMGGVLMGY